MHILPFELTPCQIDKCDKPKPQKICIRMFQRADWVGRATCWHKGGRMELDIFYLRINLYEFVVKCLEFEWFS